jgi:hypothetical protein
VRTIHVTAGQVAGFENDNAGEANWMRTDTEFNPGNSGGALIDATCHLLGVPTALSAAVEPIELARPTTRIPAAWLAALVGPDPLEVQPTEGLREIAVLSGILDRETGDDMGPNREIRYYRLPAARPGIATVSPRLVIATMGPGGRVIRESQGQVLVTASDSPTTLIAVVVPRGRDGRTPTVNLRYTPLQDRDAVAAVRSSGGGSVHGVVSRTNGGACATYVGLVAPGVDIRAATERMQRGEAPERELMDLFAALTTLESDGSFSLRASSGDAQLVVFGPQGIEHLAPIHVEEPAPAAEGTPAAGLDVGALQLSGGCRQ